MCRLRRPIVSLLLSLLMLATAVAQTKGVDVLLGKARSLEGRGRMDLAAESWRRILLADPNNAEALAGLARFAKQNGNAKEANEYLKSLRKVNPRDPAIADIEAMRSLTPLQSARLDEAGRLAAQGKGDEAMKIYHEVFGQEPPPGKWVETFYKTEAGTTGGKEDAILHLRMFCHRYPQNEVYRLWLGEVLTWNQGTRMEGFLLLQSIQAPGTVEQARTAWRQALLWEKDNPSIKSSLAGYLDKYQDPELQAILLHLRQIPPNASLDPNEERAYRALHADDLANAETLFNEVLRRSPTNVAAICGLGYIRQKQQRFSEAVEFFERAQSLAPQRVDLRDASENARFWGLMQQAAAALSQDRTVLAIGLYRSALALKPDEKIAVLGCGRALVHHGDFSEAEALYDPLPDSDPQVVDHWLELLKTMVETNAPEAALATTKRLRPSLKLMLASRPEYHAEMALACYSANRTEAECNESLRLAMDFPKETDNEDALNSRLKLASTLMEKGRSNLSLDIYRRAVASYADKVEPWEGLLGAYSQLHDNVRATEALRSIPPTTYAAFLKQTGFLNVVAAIYTEHGACQPAETMLQNSLALDKDAGRVPSIATKIQLAGLWLRAGHYEKAEQAYREIISHDQGIPDVWRGYIAALHELRANKTALMECQRIPARTLARMDQDPAYLAILAGVHSELGDKEEATQYLERARQIFQLRGLSTPADLEIQLAWVLLDSSAKKQELSSLLTHLNARADLTPNQRHAVRSIWSADALRRADLALQKNDAPQSIAILRDAANKLPTDSKIRAGLGLAFLKAGEYQKSVDVYADWGMDGAEAGDYRAAAGAAMAAHNDTFANRFLQQGLVHWPHDSKLLRMAGEQAAAQGQYDKAESYLKSSLAATHPATPEKAHQLGQAGTEKPQANGSETLSAVAAPPAMGLNTNSDVVSGTPVPAERTSDKSPSPSTTTGTTDLLDNSASGTVTGCKDLTPVRPAIILTERGATTSIKTEDTMDDVEEEKVQDEIDVIHNRNTPVVTADDMFTSRTGNPGFERLLTEDASLGSSQGVMNRIRIEADVHAVSLHSGTGDGSSYLQLGTLPRGTAFGDHSASGIAARAQLSTNNFGMFLGNTPDGFPLRNLVGGVRYNPQGGPFTITFLRDSVRETMLSYAGMRDPGSGTTWGGVISNAITASVRRGGELRGQYASLGFAELGGQHVADNSRLDGNAGAYWRVLKRSHGALTLGANVSALHFDKNLRYFTLGQGGYFSPQSYYLLTAPITWSGHLRHTEYQASASLGLQHYSEDNSPFYPTSARANLLTQPFYNAQASTGANYNVAFRMNRQLALHWNAGVFFTANNARDYATQSVGFALHYLIRRVPLNTTLRPSSIPDWKGMHSYSIE